MVVSTVNEPADRVLGDLLGILQTDALAEVAKGVDRTAVGVGGLDAVDPPRTARSCSRCVCRGWNLSFSLRCVAFRRASCLVAF